MVNMTAITVAGSCRRRAGPLGSITRGLSRNRRDEALTTTFIARLPYREEGTWLS